MRSWANALSGYRVGEVKAGLLSCRSKPWPPTLPEFLALCRPPPDFEKSFADAQEQVSRRAFNEDVWSNKALYWTAVEFGFHDLRSMSWTQAKNRWSRIYVEKLAKEDELPSIPLPMHALPEPGKSETDIETAKAHLAGIKSMIRNDKTQQERLGCDDFSAITVLDVSPKQLIKEVGLPEYYFFNKRGD